jgi:exosortase
MAYRKKCTQCLRSFALVIRSSPIVPRRVLFQRIPTISVKTSPLPPLLLLLILVVSAVYAPIVRELVRDWARDPNYSHGFLVPLISAFLLWRQRREFSRLTPDASNLGLVGILVAAALLVIGSAAAEVFTQRVSLLILFGSLVLFLGGTSRLRKVAFPLSFLLLAIPLPYILYYSLTAPMQALAARVAVLGLGWVGVPALAQGNIIHLPETSLEVAEACSGIRSLYAFLALGALLAHSMSIPLWGKLLVFLSTIPVSIAANAVRVWGSGISAYLVGPRAVEGTAHEVFGIVVFGGAILVFLLVRKGVRVLWPSAS